METVAMFHVTCQPNLGEIKNIVDEFARASFTHDASITCFGFVPSVVFRNQREETFFEAAANDLRIPVQT
jgi:hypothetical protein